MSGRAKIGREERGATSTFRIKHKDFVDFCRKILPFSIDLELSSSKKGYPIPDLISTDQRVAVECGNLSTGIRKINDLLEKYEEVWWIPHPKVHASIPVVTVIRYTRNDTSGDLRLLQNFEKELERKSQALREKEARLNQMLECSPVSQLNYSAKRSVQEINRIVGKLKIEAQNVKRSYK